AARGVRRDRGGGPVRRLGDACADDAERRRLAVEDHGFVARYGAARLRTYFAIMSNSRLTRSPRLAVPRFVRRSVSGFSAAPSEPSVVRDSVSFETSVRSAPPRSGSTVRQTPLTATLSPRSNGSSNVARRRRRAPLSSRSSDSIVPLLMMMPVNIGSGIGGD